MDNVLLTDAIVSHTSEYFLIIFLKVNV